RQGPAPAPPPDDLQCPGLRGGHDGFQCGHHRRADAPSGPGRWGGGLIVRRSPRLPPEQLAPYLLELPGFPHPSRRGSMAPHIPPEPLDWRAVFDNDHPVELEVGCGKGLFLTTAALAHPDVNFVGIEIVRKYQLFTATRLAHRALTNARVACAD